MNATKKPAEASYVRTITGPEKGDLENSLFELVVQSHMVVIEIIYIITKLYLFVKNIFLRSNNRMDMGYYMGLDIGTNSVGWAVSDKEYHLLKAKKKTLWGISLFEDANPAKDRRIARATRRRVDRKQQRIDWLQEIFAEEMGKVDPTFFIRLNESNLQRADRKTDPGKEAFKHPLFNDEHYTDKDYYKKYPTIFHLRKELIESKEKHDIRLVYLALSNILKHRGHFLLDNDMGEGDIHNFEAVFDEAYGALKEEMDLNYVISDANKENFKNILRDKSIKRSSKTKKLVTLFDSEDMFDNEEKEQKSVLEEFCGFLLGLKKSVKKLLCLQQESMEKETFSFGEANYEEETRAALEEAIPDQSYLFDLMKAVYDWVLLSDILQDEPYLSFANVKKYDLHQRNLRILKKLVRKYLGKNVYDAYFSEDYSEIFTRYGRLIEYLEDKQTVDDRFFLELEGLVISSKKVVEAADKNSNKAVSLLLDELHAKVKKREHLKLKDLLKKTKRKMKDYKKGVNYSNFVGIRVENGKRYDVKKCSNEEVEKSVKTLLEKIEKSIQKLPETEEQRVDKETVQEFLKEMESEVFPLPRQRTASNGVIPRQINGKELKKILENAATYLPFLNEKGEDGFSPKEKIEKIFEYRVPYYVGPLSERHKSIGANVWVVRKKEGYIYPWNIEDIVDFEKSNEEFIMRMINKCSYLIGEDVLPKHSLLYSKFRVLNELNNVSVYGKRLDIKTKQEFYEQVFQSKKVVRGKDLLCFLQARIGKELTMADVSGFDQNFASSLKSFLDFKKILGDDMDENMVEDIIRWKTIYGDDRKMTEKVIRQAYAGQLDNDKIKAINLLSYSGWGRLSKKLLKSIKGSKLEEQESEMSVIDAMWRNNCNLMELLSAKFSFSEKIKEHNESEQVDIKKVSYDNVVKDMIASPATKRAIWHAVQIVEEIKSVVQQAPEKIFVEMAREEKEKKRTKSRKDTLLELYEKFEDKESEALLDEMKNLEADKFSRLNVLLYFLQMGKCMYTGNSIDLSELLRGNPKWDKDHIFPQSKTGTVHGIDDLVLVEKVQNAEKRNKVLSPEIQNKMRGFWQKLLKYELITKTKYARLTKTGEFSEDDLSGFLSRQLVETRQSSKAVAHVLEKLYPDSEVVYVKANLVSNFRQYPLEMLKSRRVNDFHHAKDAYLNIVVGNVHHAKFTANPIRWLRTSGKKEYNLTTLYEQDQNYNGSCVWEKYKMEVLEDTQGKFKKRAVGGTIDHIRKTLSQDNVLHSEYTYCGKGKLFDATIRKKGEGGSIPIKKHLELDKYGGYVSAETSFFMFIEFDGKKNTRVRQIIGVPIYVASSLEVNKHAIDEYFSEQKGYKNVNIICPKIKKNALILLDGYPLRLRAENDKNIFFKNNIQLKLDEESFNTVRAVEKYLEKSKDNGREVFEQFDRIDNEGLNKLYDVLLAKLCTVYKDRPANQYDNLKEGEEKFKQSVDLKNKAKLINEIVGFMRCDIKTNGDLNFIDKGKTVGEISVNKNTVGKKEIVLIHQSVTGIYENRVKL